MYEAVKQFGKILKEVRQNRKFSQEHLAEMSGLDRTYISMLERGIKNPTLQTIIKLSEALKVAPDFFVSYSVKSPARTIKSDENGVELPLYGTSVSCGRPIGNDHQVEKSISLDKLAIKNPASTFIVKSSGESMSPTILDGDYLIVEKGGLPRSGQIVLIQIGSDFSVKRFFKSGREVIFRSENPMFKDIEIKSEGEFVICGTVVSILRLEP